MKILFSTILAVLFITAVLSEGENTTTDSTTEATESTTLSITTPTETTSTVASTTTIQTTPSTEPTTPTTTETPTTTSSSTTSTTTVPSTSEAPTTKAPQPTVPTAEDCSWNVTQDNVTCIRAEMRVIFKIPIEGRTEYIVLSHNATTGNSNCSLSNDTQSLVLSEADYYNLTMIFAREDNKVFVNETTLQYRIPGGSASASSLSKLFSVKAGSSYMCKSEANIMLENITMEVHDLHIQAFGEPGNTNFGAAEDCEADDKVSDAVPIAVGCALAALIIIVLIAYLVGRRRSRQRGYQSV